jgi:hypothetical protein
MSKIDVSRLQFTPFTYLTFLIHSINIFLTFAFY